MLETELERKYLALRIAYDNLASSIRCTDVYTAICMECRDEILIYPTISGRTDYSDEEVDSRALERLIQQYNRLKGEVATLRELYSQLVEDTKKCK